MTLWGAININATVNTMSGLFTTDTPMHFTYFSKIGGEDMYHTQLDMQVCT